MWKTASHPCVACCVQVALDDLDALVQQVGRLRGVAHQRDDLVAAVA
jgi:hypothetical protein